MPKQIAIIGAGVCGMISVKCCLEQGFNVKVFEKTDYTGGLWRFQEHLNEDGIASVMKSTVINTSKEMPSFSDFPPPAEYPNFMHNTLMVDYYDKYCQTFNFEKYVHFRHEIVSVEMNDDYDTTGRWKLQYRKLDSEHPQKVHLEVFDGVMICIGHHNTRNEPRFPGQELFRGKIVHTHSVKSAKGFEDKKVVVVGIGNSAVDAAVELSNVTKQTYLSTRRGSWIFRRVAHNGKSADFANIRRITHFIQSIIPYWLFCSYLEWNLNDWFDHEKYQLKPKHRALSSHITMNDALPNKIICGTVKVKSDIQRFTENGVIFNGEPKETQCDAVILATGYKVSIPFLSQEILPTYKNEIRLYKHAFFPQHKHPQTMALIGLMQTLGALIPSTEMQCRYFAMLNNGKLKLPQKEVMIKDIEANEQRLKKRFYQSERHTFQVEVVPYMCELAEAIGCNPPLSRYLFTDPMLFVKLIFGPLVSYQFRLTGPNAWAGARQAIMTVQKRVDAAFATNAIQAKTKVFSLSNATYFQMSILFSMLAIVITVFISRILS